MLHPRFRHGLVRLAVTYGAGLCGGLAALWLHVPLPWMLGPVAVTAVLALCGAPLHAPGFTRPVSQIVIGATVGLAFTTEVARLLLEQLPIILLLSVFTLALSIFLAFSVARLTGASPAMACIACLPIGPVEATNLAQRHGLEPTAVVFSQSFRSVVLVLGVVPAIVWMTGASGLPAFPAGSTAALPGAALLAAGATAFALVFRQAHVPNWSFLGAMTFAAMAAVMDLPVDRFPAVALGAAQLLLGVSLGVLFDIRVFLAMRRFIVATSAAACVLIACGIGLGMSLAGVMGVPLQTAALSFAPGSLAEMALTAKLIAADPAYVTAYHAVRIYVILLAAPVILRMAARQ